MSGNGSVRDLYPERSIARPFGRLIHCPGCDEDVDVIEINLGGTGRSMRPDVCGDCQAAGKDPEPGLNGDRA